MAEQASKKDSQDLHKGQIPRQGIIESPKVEHHEAPRTMSQVPPKVVVKQMPVPEVRIYSQTAPRKVTIGQKAADKITKWGGSWYFIGSFFIFLFIWMAINFYALLTVWDPYPFILLNLVLSCLAAVQAPIILMSQNREADRDRAKAERDYAVNRKAEKEVELIKKDLDFIKKRLAEINARLR